MLLYVDIRPLSDLYACGKVLYAACDALRCDCPLGLLARCLESAPTWTWFPGLLVLGATGLLYSNFLGALLLPALALFHLFFVRKERRWWQPVLLLGLAALLALPQVPNLLVGIERNLAESKELHQRALRYPEIVSQFRTPP